MHTPALQEAYAGLTTPHVADALVRLGVPIRQAPTDLRPLWAETHLVGPARPVRHHGSVDVFLEALEHAAHGDVLVVDNGGRTDEACVGDLIALEVRDAGLAGIVVWGLHRDTRDLRVIGLPVYSRGALPAGPLSVDAHPDGSVPARVGDHVVTDGDFVIADDDGVLFVPLDRAADVAVAAAAIRDTERRQATRMQAGRTLRSQLHFADYLAARARRGTTFREHLRSIDGEVEV